MEIELNCIHNPKCRKPRSCDKCGDSIKKGDKYFKYDVFWDEYTHIGVCTECEPEVTALLKEGKHWNGGNKDKIWYEGDPKWTWEEDESVPRYMYMQMGKGITVDMLNEFEVCKDALKNLITELTDEER